MSFKSRTLIGAMGLSVTLTAVSDVAPISPADQGRQLAVRQVLSRQGNDADASSLLEAAKRAHVLRNVTPHPTKANTFVVQTIGAPLCDAIVLEDGQKLALDLYNTIDPGLASARDLDGDHAVARIRTSLFALEPQFTSRVVFDLNRAQLATITRTDNEILVEFRDVDPKPSILETVRRSKSSLQHAHAQQAVAIENIRERLTRSDYEFAQRCEALRQRGQQKDASAQSLAAQVAETATTREVIRQGRETILNEHRAKADALLAEAVRTLDGASDTFLQEKANSFDTRAQIAETMLTAMDALSSDLTAIEGIETGLVAETALSDQRLAALALSPTPAQAENNFVALAHMLSGMRAPVEHAADPSFTGQFAVSAVALQSDLEQLVSTKMDIATAAPSSVAPVTETASASQEIAPASAPDSIEAVTPISIDSLTETLRHFAAQAEETAQPIEPAEPATEPAPAEQPATPAPEPTPAPVAPEPAAPQEVEAVPAPITAETIVAAKDIPEEQEASSTFRAPEQWTGDPMEKPIDLNIREMELADAVAMLGRSANINVVAGTAVEGNVTVFLNKVPLRQAMQILLQQNGLGMIEDENLIQIVTLDKAAEANRIIEAVKLEHADADALQQTLTGVNMGASDSKYISITSDTATNVLIIAGPPERVEELVVLARQLDTEKPPLLTITEAFQYSYADPKELQPIILSMLTKEENVQIGQVEIDTAGRNIIVTDVPVVIEQVRELLRSIDVSPKQVHLEGMIIDAVLRDSSQIGTQWLLNSVRRTNRRGEIVGNLQNLAFQRDTPINTTIGGADLDAGMLTFGILSGEFDIRAAIAAEVASGNSEILASPSIVAIENKEAEILIVQDFPYIQLTQSTQGPPVASTEFKEIGVTMNVTPKVTHQDTIFATIKVKQSSVSGITQDGVPIEEKRSASTEVEVENGETIFIGGLRNVSDRLDTNKVPVLGDLPILGVAFKNTDTEKIHSELLVFLTTTIMSNELLELTPAQDEEFGKLGNKPEVPNAQRAMFHNIVKPGDMRDPAWKWRRTK